MLQVIDHVSGRAWGTVGASLESISREYPPKLEQYVER